MSSAACLLGVRVAFEAGERHLSTISDVLQAAGLPPYAEAFDQDAAEARHDELRRQARCTVDTLGPALPPLARMILRTRGANAGPFKDMAMGTERIFVPGDFTQRLDAPRLPGRCLWSTGAFRTALRHAALALGIPLVSGEVPPLAIKQIGNKKKLSKNDPVSLDEDEHGFTMLEHYRPVWLTLAEFCEVAHKNQIALSLA
jgi:hypothetical protein